MSQRSRASSIVTRRRLSTLVGATLAALLAASPAGAQPFPQARPITLVVPFAAGGGSDTVARDLARVLEKKLGQSVVVDNKGGAGGVIAAQFVNKAAPDGYTLFFATSTLVSAAAFDRKLPYDVEKDFTPIALIGSGPLLIVVNKDLGIKTLPQLIERAKAKPGELNYVSSGTGSILHLASELFVQKTGAKMTHIPYRGSNPALVDLLAGNAQVAITTVPTILGHVKSGSVTLLAVAGRERMKMLPDTPTALEAGVKDYVAGTWWSVMGPPGMPADLVAKLNVVINESAATGPVADRFANEGATPFAGKPEDLAKQVREELASWRKVVQDGGLKLN
jgi:tripartite-type tricarboxylate transporter receptor subunit TctC